MVVIFSKLKWKLEERRGKREPPAVGKQIRTKRKPGWEQMNV